MNRSIAVLLLLATLLPERADAQSFALSVKPATFDITLAQGKSWSSELRIFNPNDRAIEVYLTPVALRQREGERRLFEPVFGQPDALSAAAWLELPREPLRIAAERSVTIGFTVNVPPSAEPGSHYGAILIGPKIEADGSGVSISTLVSSVLLVKVPGDVVEAALIKDLSTDRSLYTYPTVQFTLSFANTGTVHLDPEGEVIIRNMWGKERGRLQLSTDKALGTVLPGATEEFTFGWSGSEDFFDIGMYRAEIKIRPSATSPELERTATFWMVPLWPTLSIVSLLALFFAFAAWSIRRYVRRAVALGAAQLGGAQLMAPVKVAIADVRQFAPQGRSAGVGRIILYAVRRYALFFASITVFILGGIGIYVLATHALVERREFSFTIPDAPAVSIINASGFPGAAIELSAKLREAGYAVSHVTEAVPHASGPLIHTRSDSQTFAHDINSRFFGGKAAVRTVPEQNEAIIIELTPQ